MAHRHVINETHRDVAGARPASRTGRGIALREKHHFVQIMQCLAASANRKLKSCCQARTYAPLKWKANCARFCEVESSFSTDTPNRSNSMKRTVSILVATLMLFAVGAFADTVYNSFTTYQPYWHPLGYPNTSTYGETFNAPSNGDDFLQSFSLYLAGPYSSGDIIMSAYIAQWTGTHAGTL